MRLPVYDITRNLVIAIAIIGLLPVTAFAGDGARPKPSRRATENPTVIIISFDRAICISPFPRARVSAGLVPAAPDIRVQYEWAGAFCTILSGFG